VRTRRVWLLVEYLLLFIGVAVLLAVYRLPGGPIPLLLALGPAAWWYLRRRPDFDRRDLGRPEAVRPALWPILRLWLLATVVGIGAIALIVPGWLFNLPRQEPWLWAAVVVFYPLLSALPRCRAVTRKSVAPVNAVRADWWPCVSPFPAWRTTVGATRSSSATTAWSTGCGAAR
jgi:hypothetical protein